MRRKHCFELFGLDFMIDCEFNCWLIEVNTNPCIEESSELLKTLIPRMIDDMFKLTIDKVFVTLPPLKNKNQFERPSPYKVPGYSSVFNMWEKLANLSGKNKIECTKPIQKSNVYFIYLLKST